jgi:hypothetical protein
MNPIDARAMVNTIRADHRERLAHAYLRYMHFTGVYTGDISAEQIEADRAQFPHLLKRDEQGRPVVSDQRCAEFMAMLTGLSHEICLAWDEYEFAEMHGDDYLETMADKSQED